MNLDFKLVEPTPEKISMWGPFIAQVPDEIIKDMTHNPDMEAAEQIIKYVESELKQNKNREKSKTKVVSR